MASSSWKRLVRFYPKPSDDGKRSSQALVGQPEDDDLDIGLALREGKTVRVRVYEGTSVLNAGSATDEVVEVDRVLSPLSQQEVGTIRCIGLNYRQHAAEAKMEEPKLPVLFMKPATSLGDPYPAPTVLPKQTLSSDTGDYESELAVVIGKACKNVSESDALNYVLGYTACNDISCREAQFAQSQWGFSKGFDGACPLGPVLASSSLISDPSKLHIRGIGVKDPSNPSPEVLQDCGIDDLIFKVPKLISFLSQSTTLLPGTVIVTGTPAGVGFARQPKYTLKPGEEFRVEIMPHIGTLCTVFEAEK